MPIIINKHTVEITHGTQKHTQNHLVCSRAQTPALLLPSSALEEQLESCHGNEQHAKEQMFLFGGVWGEVLHQNVGGPFWVYETTQLLWCCPETVRDLSAENLEAVGGEPTTALQKHFWKSHLTTILNLCQGPGGLFFLHQKFHMLLSSQNVKKCTGHLAG